MGELNSRITNDVAALQDTLSITLAEFFRQTTTLLVGIGLLFYRSVHLTLIMLMSFPVIIILAVFLENLFARYLNTHKMHWQKQILL